MQVTDQENRWIITAGSRIAGRRPSLCYAGTYERGYPRNRLVIRALRDAGARVEEAHVPVFERLTDKSGLNPLRLFALALRLAFAYSRLVPEVALRLLRCDALVTGYIGQLDTLVLGPIAKLIGRPVIFNPLVTLTDTLVEDRRLALRGSLPARLIGLTDRLALRMVDVVVADTDENAAWISRRFDIPEGRIIVMPVGVEEEIFYPADPANVQQAQHTGEQPLDVLFYGKFIPLHGTDTIIRAAASLAREGANVRIEMVGTGQDYDSTRRLALALGADNITWTDWLPFERLGERIRAAGVVLGVFDGGSKAARVIPNKVHQALACGVPVITRDAPAVRRLLQPDVSAILVPPDDPAALAAAIRRMRDPDLRRTIGAAGRLAWSVNAGGSARAERAGCLLSLLDRRP